MNVLFSSEYQSQLKDQVSNSYLDFITEIREDIYDQDTCTLFSEEFIQSMKEILKDEELNQYSSLKFYWINLLDNLTYVGQIHQELAHSFDLGNKKGEYQEIEEELFSFWNDSDLAINFSEFLSQDLTVEDASFKLLPILEEQILAFYYLQISNNKTLPKDGIVYKAVPEIGDFEKRIYLTEKSNYVEISNQYSLYPLFFIKNVDFKNRTAVLNDNQKLINCHLNPLGSYNIFNTQFYLIPNCNEGIKMKENFVNKIELALKTIQIYSPESFQVLCQFSKYFIPINEPGIVSYSMQSLPEYSCINMFERDFVDLMDDLLHENGHHYLNAHLNIHELIHEDDEKIYYSPWRKSLRPIRGIYHAVFTFYWAFKLFSDLSKNISNTKTDSPYLFSKEEHIKIYQRMIEEFLMINSTKTAIKHASKYDKITEEGRKLIDNIFDLVQANTRMVEEYLLKVKDMSPDHFLALEKFKKELEKEQKHFKI